ncbi:MAG TPA: hypothetical protein DD473_11305 [Planctomycetaceae bacterium]|nr:hypothetical protein [Planctomycetaceae bacterium]
MVVGLLEDKQAATLNAGSLKAFQGIPDCLVLTLTTGNGTEFSCHAILENDLSCSVYYAAPCCLWQRGQN